MSRLANLREIEKLDPVKDHQRIVFLSCCYEFPYRFTEANRRVGSATRELFVSWFPRLFAPLVRKTIYALLDDSVIEAFGFDRPSYLMRRLIGGALCLRGPLAGLFPARRRPRLRTQMPHPSYPNGYVIEELGPPTAE